MPGGAFNSSQIAVLVKESFEPTFQKTFERNTFFAQFIADRKQTLVEKDITWKAYYAGTPGAGSYAENGSIGINRTDLGPRYTTARLAWRMNAVPISITGLAQAISKSPSSVIDATAEQTADAIAELQKNMNRQCLSDGFGNINGADPTLNPYGYDMTGILAAFDDGSAIPIYAGIDRSSATFWRAFVLANASGIDRPITEELMHQMLNELEALREATIDQITCSLSLLTQVGILLGQDRRYNIDTTGGAAPSYAGGFQSVTFNGKKITGIPLYKSGRMDFWSKEHLSFKVLLDFTIEARDAGDADASKMFAKIYAQLQYKNPWQSGSLRNLLE